jgi:hypothetical protein
MKANPVPVLVTLDQQEQERLRAFVRARQRRRRMVANALWHLREHCGCEAVAKCFLAQCPRRAAASQPSYAGQAV